MKKNIKNIFFTGLVTLSLVMGCTADFEEMNTNPNLFTEPNTDLVLPFVLKEMGRELNFDVIRRHGATFGQYFVNHVATAYDRFDQESGFFNLYRPLVHADYIYNKAEELGHENRMGVALVLKVFMFAKMTDEMGDIPYSQALDPTNYLNPAYDKQEDIYTDMLANLEKANELLSAIDDNLSETADILYGGDVFKWQRFANSLRLRLLMRVSNKINVDAKIKEIVENPAKYPLFEGNGDNAELPMLSKSGSYSSPLGVSANLGDRYYNERSASATIVDMLKAMNDPRLGAYYEPTEANPAEYVGVPAGIDGAASFNGGIQFQSKLSAKFAEDDNDYLNIKFITYSEVMFLVAEAIQRGIASGNAGQYYLEGIQSSMDYWDLTPDPTYYTQPSVAYDGTLKQIITQKWLANFCVGNEAWCDYRRTGFPDFVIGPATMLGGGYAQRLMYPDGEESINVTSLNNAIQQQGPDEMDTKMWYLK